LKSNFSTSIKGGKVKLPDAFTEKGLYMIATIIKSSNANQTDSANLKTLSSFNETLTCNRKQI